MIGGFCLKWAGWKLSKWKQGKQFLNLEYEFSEKL